MTNPIPSQIPNSTSHQSPHIHIFHFWDFPYQTLSIFIPTFPEKLKYPLSLQKKKKKNIKHAFPFLSLFFSPNTPKPPLPLFVSEDNPNSLAGKKKFRVFFSGKEWWPQKTTPIGSSITDWWTIFLFPMRISLFLTRLSLGLYRLWMVLPVLGICSALLCHSRFWGFAQFSLIGVLYLVINLGLCLFLGSLGLYWNLWFNTISNFAWFWSCTCEMVQGLITIKGKLIILIVWVFWGS